MATRKTPGTTPRATTRRPAAKRAAKPAASAPAPEAEAEASPAAEKPAAKPRKPAAAKTAAPKAPAKTATARSAKSETPAAPKRPAAPKPVAPRPAAKRKPAAPRKAAAPRPAPSPSVVERIQSAPTPVKAAGIAGLVAALGGAVLGALRIFRRRPTEGTVPTDLMGAEHPDGSERAIDDFRPDPTAPVPASEREALRPALAKPSLIAGQEENLPPSRH